MCKYYFYHDFLSSNKNTEGIKIKIPSFLITSSTGRITTKFTAVKRVIDAC